MRYLGLDLGTKTLGIALSDKTNTIASTFKTITFKEEDYNTLLPIIKEIVTEYEITEIVLGYPKNMNNTIGQRASQTEEFKKMLENYLNIIVNLQDERLSSKEANYYLLESDMSRKKRKKVVDKLAANIILQTYLDKIRKEEKI